jgi:DNA polymerase, archaea type
MTNQELIFGKNPLQRVVGLEVTDNSAEIFQELLDGSIKSTFVENLFWILSPIPMDSDWVRLDGDLYYKYGKQITTREEFTYLKRKYRNNNIYSIWDERESLMVKDGISFYRGLKPTEISICSFDIETTGLNPNESDAQVLLITNTVRKSGVISRKLFSYDEYKSEEEMLVAWCDWVRDINPSILLGHNIFGFDLNYLNERANHWGIQLQLGRDGSGLKKGHFEKKFRVDGSRDLSYFDFRVYGRELVDTMFLAYKADAYERKYNSYGLKAIIKQEGWEAKDRVYYDASQIRYNYKDPVQWSLIKDYCIDDGDESLLLFDKFVPPFFYQGQSIPKSFQAVIQSASGSQLNSILVRAYLQQGHSLPKASEAVQFEGAISFGVPGLFKNAVRFDFAAMYPSIMLQYEIYDKQKDPNKYLLIILDYLRTERLKNKQLAKETGQIYYKHMEQSGKILINSIYGFLGSTGLIFNYPQGAAEVTKKGRELLSYCIKWASGNELERYRSEK